MFRTSARQAAGLLLLALVPGSSQQPIEPAKLKALLIGNTSYRHMPACPTSGSNVQALQSSLNKLGFAVKVVSEADFEKLQAEIHAFAGNIAKDDIAFFYYSGYAIQHEGDNHLIPVDFPAEKADLDSQTITLARVESLLKDRGAESRILILEAARENAVLKAQFPDAPAGLSMAYNFSPGTLVAFPAPSGRLSVTAPQSPMDPFSQALAEKLREPGLTPAQLFEKVRSMVSEATGGAQVPAITTQLGRDFYLTGPPPRIIAGPKPGEARQNPLDKQEYVWIPPGQFTMGCVPDDPRCEPDEKPRHKVTISKGFWMGRTEVEVGTYKTYASIRHLKMPKPPQAFKNGWNDESRPMAEVSWDDATAFCKYAGGRLPSEAEWEYAARSGVEGQIFSWGKALSREKANFFGTGGHDIWDGPSPVRKFDPNAWNLYDMSGNVWEWCLDWYDAAYYGKSPEVDPPGAPSAKDHVKRGGSHQSAENELRLSIRRHFSGGDNNTGFRCVVENLTR
jgi:sulfatase modifying factor 1